MSADDGDEYDITSLLEDSKKQKKWRKRVEKAEVNYREGYLLARHVCGFDVRIRSVPIITAPIIVSQIGISFN